MSAACDLEYLLDYKRLAGEKATALAGVALSLADHVEQDKLFQKTFSNDASLEFSPEGTGSLSTYIKGSLLSRSLFRLDDKMDLIATARRYAKDLAVCGVTEVVGAVRPIWSIAPQPEATPEADGVQTPDDPVLLFWVSVLTWLLPVNHATEIIGSLLEILERYIVPHHGRTYSRVWFAFQAIVAISCFWGSRLSPTLLNAVLWAIVASLFWL